MSNWQRGNDKPSVAEKKSSAMRQALRYAYSPRFDKNIGQIGQTMGMFPRLLANVFAMQGLFPHNHPALRDPAMRLKMTDVISLSYRSLEWNKAGMPKVMFFFAVVISLVFSLLAFGFALMGFFTAPAHAASIFTAPDPTTDLSNTWLEHVFNGANFTVAVPQTNVTNSPSTATYLTTMSGAPGSIVALFRSLAAMYSNAMLVLAVIIVVYHLLSMVVHTAHDGTPMGRGAHQIWAPVRFVFALGLLVPVAGGFSSGQWLVMWLAKQGSGLASYVWGDSGAGVGQFFINQGTRVVIKPDLQPEAMYDQLYAIGYCAKDKQMQLSSDRGYWIGAPPSTITPAQAQDVTNALVMSSFDPKAIAITGPPKNKQIVVTGNGVDSTPGLESKYYYAVSETPIGSGNYEASWADKPCGRVVFSDPAADPNMAGHPDLNAMIAVHRAHIAAFQAIEFFALQDGATMAAGKPGAGADPGNRIEGYNGLNTYGQAPVAGSGAGVLPGASRQLLINLYRTAYEAYIAGAGVPGLSVDASNHTVVYNVPAGTYSAATAKKITGNTGMGGAGDLGWMSAGGYFASMATKGNTLQQAANMVPVVTRCSDTTGECDDQAETLLAMQTAYEGEKLVGAGDTSCGLNNIMQCLENIGMMLMGVIGLANDKGEWVWHTIFSSPYPVSDMINLGGKLVDGAIACLITGVVLNLLVSGVQLMSNVDTLASGGGSKILSMLSKVKNAIPSGKIFNIIRSLMGGASALMGVIANGLFALAALLILPGVLLFYILPMLPFLNFLTGIITWLVSLLQAVAAIPVIAIAHLTPNGEGLPSGAARGAYTMMLQIFLRPVMMIFGLIVAVLIMNTGIGILNTLFFNIYKQTVTGGSYGLLSSLVFFVIYAGAAYAIVNAANTAIDDFPLKSVTWIGGGQGVDSNHDFGKVGQMVAAHVAGQAFGQIAGASRSLSAAPGQWANQTAGQIQQRQAAAATSDFQQRTLTQNSNMIGAANPAATGAERTGMASSIPNRGEPPAMNGPSAPSGNGPGPGGAPPLPSGYTTSSGGIAMPERASSARSPAAQANMEAKREGRPHSDINFTNAAGHSSAAGNNRMMASAMRNLNSRADGQRTYDAIRAASARYGVSTDYMLLKAQQESGFNNSIRAKTSSATGLYQFIDSTWMATFRQHGAEIGMGDLASKIDARGNVSDPEVRQQILNLRANAEVSAHMGAAFAADNADYMQRRGVEVNSTTLYLAHFLGAGGAVTFMRGMAENPNASAADLMPKAAAANRGVFYDPAGRERTVSDVYNFFSRKMGGDGQTMLASAPRQPMPASPVMQTASAAAPVAASVRTADAAQAAQQAPSGIDPHQVALADSGGGGGSQEEAQPSSGWSLSAIGHGILGLSEFVPGVSIVAGAINGAWYAAEGNYVQAGLSASSMIPGAKIVTTAGKGVLALSRTTGVGAQLSARAIEMTAGAGKAVEATSTAGRAAGKVATQTAAKEATQVAGKGATNVAAKTTSKTGTAARAAAVADSLLGNNSGGTRVIQQSEEPFNPYALLMAKWAMDYINGKKRNTTANA